MGTATLTPRTREREKLPKTAGRSVCCPLSRVRERAGVRAGK
jgi:hypothetical protein